MPTWLDSATTQLGNLVEAEFFEPQVEVGEKDHIVGTAGEEIRRLFTLAQLFTRKAMETAVEARFSHGTDQEKILVKSTRLAKNAEVLMEILWISVKDSFNLWGRPSIGLRKGWQVVWTDQPDMPTLGDVLGGLFGGR